MFIFLCKTERKIKGWTPFDDQQRGRLDIDLSFSEGRTSSREYLPSKSTQKPRRPVPSWQLPWLYLHVHHDKAIQNYCNNILGTIVRRTISTNPGLNCNSGFLISLSKNLYGIIFIIPFFSIRSSTCRQKWQNFLLQLLDLKLNFSLTLGYLNLALNRFGRRIFLLSLIDYETYTDYAEFCQFFSGF